MQIARLRLQNFKGIEDLELSFLKEGTDEPRPVTLLLGDNGAGKTTVLQAIAFVLSQATGKLESSEAFQWPGFLQERISTLGTTEVEIDIRFTTDEIAAILQVIRLAWRDERGISLAAAPPLQSTLRYQAGRLSWRAPGITDDLQGLVFQSHPNHNWLLQNQPQYRELSSRIGDVFWFDQNRNVLSLQELREEMITLWAAHHSVRRSSVPDYLGEIERRFAELFPGTRFIGVEPKKGAREFKSEDMYFLLERGGRVYDIAEMSSGEQAIFPLLYSFVLQGISRSVVLIDELELHLHPPQQQSLMAALRRIGPDCQFIVTSHSPYLEQMTPDEDEIRLPGGQRCL